MKIIKKTIVITVFLAIFLLTSFISPIESVGDDKMKPMGLNVLYLDDDIIMNFDFPIDHGTYLESGLPYEIGTDPYYDQQALNIILIYYDLQTTEIFPEKLSNGELTEDEVEKRSKMIEQKIDEIQSGISSIF